MVLFDGGLSDEFLSHVRSVIWSMEYTSEWSCERIL